ncbi:hypothetical protein [Yersinia intermedia]|uniref:hypothetical protein n=1 Tax=Yersinia intermedia TaxID=631 RepID=UPI0022FE5B71|nr:hypothetical protein [Yersinia intermedia]MDA5514441.1 hypothetical protein [Yersinia intermedia]
MKTEKDTVDYTIRGFSKDFDNTLSHLSILWNKPKSVILRELAELHLTDRIKMFGTLNKHVAILDEMLAKHLCSELLDKHFESHFSTKWNMEMCSILGIHTDDDLEQILVRNTPYITVRADQVLESKTFTTKGLALWFALFAELASSSPEAVWRAWRNIFHSYGGAAYFDYYKKINEIRKLKGGCVIVADRYDITLEGELCTVNITKPVNYQYGAWHADITLQPFAVPDDPEVLSGLRFPKLEKRLIIAQRGTYYQSVAYSQDREPETGFAFTDGRCELDIYSNGCEEDFNPTPLQDVAKALAAVTDERLKPLHD